MAHSFDTSLRITGSGNPVTANYTCGSGATVLVLAIITGGSTARAGGAPTYNGVAMTEVYSGIKAASSPETVVDMYYLLNPPTGSALQISIPNTGSKSLYCMASSYKAASGHASVFDVKNNATATSTNPTCSVTTTDDAVLIACVGNGAQTWNPTGRTGTQLGDYDDGSYGDGHQYYIKSGSGSQAMAWTFGTSDDWAEIVVAFKELTAYEYTASGGLTLGGTAPISYTKDYTYITSGGIVTGGSAVCSYEVSSFEYVATGGVSVGGTAIYDYTKDYAYITSGGVNTGGTAVYQFTRDYSYETSGGVNMGGTAVYDFTRNYIFETSGGLAVGGGALYSYEIGGTEFEYIASGGLVLSGNALYAFTNDYVFEGSGELLINGAADCLYNPNFTYLAQGGLLIGGSAEYISEIESDYVYIGNGGLKIGGEAICIFPAYLRLNIRTARVKLNVDS